MIRRSGVEYSDDRRGGHMGVRTMIDVLRMMGRGRKFRSGRLIAARVMGDADRRADRRGSTDGRSITIMHVGNEDLERAPARGQGNAQPHQPSDRHSGTQQTDHFSRCPRIEYAG